MAVKPTLYGPDGQPIDRQVLTDEVATVTGVRSILANHPERGLTPGRLGMLLREAEDGDPTAQCELAEGVEEKYLHYQGVLGTRKRQVSQLPITVIAAGDDAASQRDADLIRQFLSRDTLQAELFDVLDAIGKGYSFTEILWSTDGGRWMPRALAWRDPRWFRWSRDDGVTPLMLDEGGMERPLPPYKFIRHTVSAKSGLPVRGGLIRGISWYYLFQVFGLGDWIQFVERYGQPIRIGKYGKGATEREKETLLRAVRNIAADAGAIIPEGMVLELIEARITGNVDQFERLARFLNGEVSKAVLGQTATTEVQGGSYAAAKVHNDVREDIEQADAQALAAVLNRDLIRPIIDLNFGSRSAYPRLQIGKPDAVNIPELADALAKLVPLGLTVQTSDVRDKLGFADPDPKAVCLAPQGQTSQDPASPNTPPRTDKAAAKLPLEESTPEDDGRDAIERLADQETSQDWEPMIDPLISQIEQMAAQCSTAEEFLDKLPELAIGMETDALAKSLGRCMFAARAAGAGGVDIGNGPAEPDDGHAG